MSTNTLPTVAAASASAKPAPLHWTRQRPWLMPLAAVALVAVGVTAGTVIGRHSADAPSIAKTEAVATVPAATDARKLAAAEAHRAADTAADGTAKRTPIHDTPSHPATTRHGSTASAGDDGPRSAPVVTQPTKALTVCASCGTVESVHAETRQGQGSGVGAVAGGVVGGLLGNQVGKGGGRTAATVLGAVGGGYVGNEIEKRQRATTVYVVKVRMDDGTLRSFTRNEAWSAGQRVTVDGSALRARSDTGGASGANGSDGTSSGGTPMLRTSTPG